MLRQQSRSELAGHSAMCRGQWQEGFTKPFLLSICCSVLSCSNSSLSQMMLWTMRTAWQYSHGNSSKGKVGSQLLLLFGDGPGALGQYSPCKGNAAIILELTFSPSFHDKYPRPCADCNTLLNAALLGRGVCHTPQAPAQTLTRGCYTKMLLFRSEILLQLRLPQHRHSCGIP